jgi:MFS transporter, DHA2 family, multidrug resistance protein
VALPFLFIPINTVAYDGLAANKTNQGSALMNVARNLGGSIGISVANVVLTQRSQLHQARLVENTVPSSPVFQSTLSKLTQYFISQGTPPADAQGQAIGYIGHLIQAQATLLAYIDVFEVCAIAAAIMIPIVLIMVRRVQIGRVSAAAH